MSSSTNIMFCIKLLIAGFAFIFIISEFSGTFFPTYGLKNVTGAIEASLKFDRSGFLLPG